METSWLTEKKLLSFEEGVRWRRNINFKLKRLEIVFNLFIMSIVQPTSLFKKLFKSVEFWIFEKKIDSIRQIWIPSHPHSQTTLVTEISGCGGCIVVSMWCAGRHQSHLLSLSPVCHLSEIWWCQRSNVLAVPGTAPLETRRKGSLMYACFVHGFLITWEAYRRQKWTDKNFVNIVIV